MAPTLSDVQTVIRLQLGLKHVQANDHLVEQLGAESADIVNIVVALEEKYGIEIDESSMAEIGTVAELYELVGQLS